MKSLHTGIAAHAHGHPSSFWKPRSESTRDVLDVLASGISKAAFGENKPEPQLLAEVTTQPRREFLTKKMLANPWTCSAERLRRWRTVGEGQPYLKIAGKVLYRVKDIEAYWEASLVRRMLQTSTRKTPNGFETVRTNLNQFELILAGQ